MAATAKPGSSGRALLTVLLILVSLAVALGIGEVATRVLGFKPWAPWIKDSMFINDVPIMTEKHPVRGWTNKPGEYVYGAYEVGGDPVIVTNLPDNSRRTNDRPHRPERAAMTLVFAGGSNTFGTAISDHETYAWQVQEKFPDFDVYNFAVAGYGTLQSLLTLQEKLPGIPGKKIVIYGFIGHHPQRNVVDSGWVKMLAVPGKAGQLPPYATINEDGDLEIHPVSFFTPWPLKDKLAIVNTAETAYIELQTRAREQQKYAVTEKLVLEMQHLAKSGGAEFVVIFLKQQGGSAAMAEAFAGFLDSNGVNSIDCSPGEYTDDMIVKIDGHPNGKVHSIWANCSADYLRDALL